MKETRSQGSEDGFVDLTGIDYEQVLLICEALVGCGNYVLHGSNVHPPLRQLEPRPANDATRLSGNQVAIYASVAVAPALTHAVVNRKYLASRLSSYMIGYRVLRDRVIFKVTDNVYELLRQKDSEVCADGYLYVMDRASFVRSADCFFEFHAAKPLQPHRILKVSGTIGTSLFHVDAPDGYATVVPYDVEAVTTAGPS
jgi:hypothetical protein